MIRRVGCRYRYEPVPLDAFIHPPYGAITGQLKSGDVVRVMKPHHVCRGISSTGQVYMVSEIGCTCPDFTFRKQSAGKTCKHIRKVFG